ncbi:hypothetical protein HY249_03235 [Candidatus Azambacteria bacterium]|nr:hypothetical protein [Candidatus Azambacteria bacterium]
MYARKIAFLTLVFAGIFAFSGHVSAQEALKDGSLVKGVGEKVYFMENGMKRWITNPDVFSGFGFNWDKIKIVSDESISAYPLGVNLENASRYPEGALIRQENGTKVYLVKNGAKSWVKDEASFSNLGLSWDSIMDIPEQNIKKIYEGVAISQSVVASHPFTILKKKPGDVIEDISVDFEFTAIAGKNIPQSDLLFETFLEGFDRNWVATSAQSRIITLPQESKYYTFFIRAKFKDGGADLIPEKHAFLVKLSPFFRDIRISSASPRASTSSDESVLLANATKIPMKITGWALESDATKSKYDILDAYETPNHSSFEYKSDVILNPNGRAYIYSGRSPSGYSFRMNKCVGYLNSTYKFSPPLQSQCPRPSSKDIENLTSYCQKKISQLSACQNPDTNDFLLDNDCRAYMMNHLNYTACVNENRNFYDFFQDEWRVFLGTQSNIWKDEHDTIILRDKNGLVVDRYKY